eukprot:Clim_evm23s231 gene=Clim_evmTU23s231
MFFARAAVRAVGRRGYATAPQDPIQKLYVEKIREYAASRSKAGGKQDFEKMQAELDKVTRQFGIKHNLKIEQYVKTKPTPAQKK